ncbi:MAG: M15 family metallopeptidase [Nanoarchaeota archaeon]
MAQENPQPEQFNMKDLFIDVKLEACVGGTTFDFLGRKLFSTQFFREGVGFGITGIDIEINASLQPIVTVTFKDLYGLTVFGGQSRNADTDGQSHDYSVLFNWPPPKFLFTFKGYLGRPATWVLNLKRATTSFNSSDGSYDIKCEFVPNQWGFFADLPFLYLLAVKRLRKDRIGPGATDAQLRNVISVFDLIKIGKQVEIKTQDTTKEFDELSKQLGSLKSNMANSIVSAKIVSWGDTIDGLVNNQPVTGFIPIQIPTLESLDPNIGKVEAIELRLGIPGQLNALNTYLLLSLKFNGKDNFGQAPKNYAAFEKAFSIPGGSDAINTAKANALQALTNNLNKIDEEIKRRVFASSESKLEKITIGEIFSQLAKDSGFIMGSILDAGLDGYRGEESRRALRDRLVEDGILIGESFPMILVDGEEVPATDENLKKSGIGEAIGVDEHEMQFVKNFIAAVSEGIAKDLLANNPQAGEDDSILKQRVNNMEMSSGNPYKPYYSNIATNILVRGGIAAYFTRSNDPNLPGDYDTTFGGDRDDIQSIQELADRDMQNITDNLMKTLSDIDFLLVKRFATFFSRYFDAKCEGVADSSGVVRIPFYFGSLASPAQSFQSSGDFDLAQYTEPGGKNVFNWKIVMSNPNQFGEPNSAAGTILTQINAFSAPELAQIETKGVETLTFGQVWGELVMPHLLQNVEIIGEALQGFTDIEDAESRREDQLPIGEGALAQSLFSEKKSTTSEGVRDAQNPLTFVDPRTYLATRIVNNGIAYHYPHPDESSNTWWMVLFRGENHKRALEANSAPTDVEFKNVNKDSAAESAGFNEPLGYVPLNKKYGDEDSEDTDNLDNGKFMLKRVGSLMKYRDENGGLVFDFDKCKNPGPAFYGIPPRVENSVMQGLLTSTSSIILWKNAYLQDPLDSGNPSGGPVDYEGNLGYSVCAHLGTDADSANIFGLFSYSRQGRNHRAYIQKCAKVILEKIKAIEDERNQIIGEVLGKAGEQEGSIYKQMHTLFHQWQALSYSDKNGCNGNVDENKGGDGGENGKVFDNAKALEDRFGKNHRDLQYNEQICFSQEELAEGTNLTAEELQSLTQVSTGPNAGKICLNISNQTQSASVPDGTFIYDYPLQRISAPEEPIDVRDAIINLEPLYKPNANTSILNIIQQVCTKNNFLFIPIPGNPGYLNVKDIYSPSREPANIEIRNFFHVLFTPTPESRTKTRNTDGTSIADSDKQRTYNVNSFVIKYGHPNNNIVSNIQVGTEENKVTAESIVNLQRLVDNENQNKKVTTDCSMLPVLAGRSYKASVDMLGNSQCYPMQFFFLENSPLFGGLYQIMKVKHVIDPNNMKTTVEGIRMRFAPGSGYGSIKPITLNTFRNLGLPEAPLARGEGFDSADKEALKQFSTNTPSPGTVSRSANVSDYINEDFVNGINGGPVAQPIAILPTTTLNSYDTSLGLRDLWSEGKIIGQAQMYIFDGYPMTAQVTSAYKAMKDAAQIDGITLKLESGYRDPFKNIIDNKGKFISTAQYELRRQNVKNKSKQNDDNWLRTAASDQFDPATARPGFSNHNSGIAVDLNCGGAKFNNFNQTIYEWLMLNAYKFGFVRTVTTEEWHWEYRPGKPMFVFDNRNGTKWYGLPDKLGIPLNKPTEAVVATSGGATVQAKGNYTVYVLNSAGVIKETGEVTRDKEDEFIITIPNKTGALEAAIFSCGIEEYPGGSPAAGYRADVANAAPVALSEKRVMVYAHWTQSLSTAQSVMNGLLSGLQKSAVVKSVLMYSKGGKNAGTFYNSSYRFFGLCDPSPEGSAATKPGNYGPNTYLSKKESNWGTPLPEWYQSGIASVEQKVSNGGGNVEDTSTSHVGYPAYFMNKHIDLI